MTEVNEQTLPEISSEHGCCRSRQCPPIVDGRTDLDALGDNLRLLPLDRDNAQIADIMFIIA